MTLTSMLSGRIYKRRGVELVPLAGGESAYVFVTMPPAVYIVDSFTEQVIALCDGESVDDVLSIVQEATQLEASAAAAILDDLFRKKIIDVDEASTT